VQRLRGGLVFKAHRLVYHSTLGLRVIKKKNTPARGFGVWGLGVWVEGVGVVLRLRVWGVGFGVQGLDCRIWGVG